MATEEGTGYDDLCEQYNNASPMAGHYVNMSDKMYPGVPTIWKKLDYVDVLKVLAFIVTIVGGLLGNICVMLVVLLKRSMRTTVNIYLVNLALSDALIVFTCMMPNLVKVLANGVYTNGEVMCKIEPFGHYLCRASSVLTLSAISCDRFMAIIFPLRARITKQRPSMIITTIWILAFVIATPLAIVYRHRVIEWKNFKETQCDEEWPHEWHYDNMLKECIVHRPLFVLYYVSISLVIVILPILIMMVVYSSIFWRLRKAQAPGGKDGANADVQLRTRKKVNKMIVLVLLVFIVCWLPLQSLLMYLMFIIRITPDYVAPNWLGHFFWFSYYISDANSFMNPFIYAGLNTDFRKGLRSILGCGCLRDTWEKARATVSLPQTTLTSASKSVTRKSNMETKLKCSAADENTASGLKETCFTLEHAKEAEILA